MSIRDNDLSKGSKNLYDSSDLIGKIEKDDERVKKSKKREDDLKKSEE